MNKGLVIFTTLISVFLIGIGVYGAFKNINESTIDDTVDNTENNKKTVLTCSHSEYQSIYNATVETTVKIEFDNNYIKNSNIEMKFMFNDQNSYDTWKNATNIDMNTPGMTSGSEFDDENKILISTIKQDYSEIPPENINTDFPTNYEGAKSHFVQAGYMCN